MKRCLYKATLGLDSDCFDAVTNDFLEFSKVFETSL